MTNHRPYHLIALVHGDTPADIAASLRAYADHIEAGRTPLLTGSSDRLILRQEDPSGGEESGSCRMYAVFADGEGIGADDAIAMFRDEGAALRYVQGKPLADDGETTEVPDGAVLRTDCVISTWNSYDPDPHEDM